MKKARNKSRKSGESLERRIAHLHQPDEARDHPLLGLQRSAGNRAVVGLLESDGHPQTKPRVPSGAVPQIQRAPRNGAAASTPAPEVAAERAAGTLIVEDDAAKVGPGQMRKSEFLEQLRSTVCATADAALEAAGESTRACPYIEQWLAYYAEREPAHIERALRKYAPEAATARNAREYIPAVANRVRRGVETWVKTGELTGVPDELRGILTGPGAVFGAIGGILGSIGSVIGGAVSSAVGAIGGAFSSIGKALFKRKEGHAEQSDDPQAIQGQLRGGQPLDGGARSRMGAAFGYDFSGVRVHTGGEAPRLSEQLNARAFTVGSDIAFGAGEYQPGTMIGDALIAHELAHVVQQSGGKSTSSPQTKTDHGHDGLEEDADVAAVGAVSSLWLGAQNAITGIGREALPRMRSGLRLQSCEKTKYITNRGGDVESVGDADPSQPDLSQAVADETIKQTKPPGLLPKLKKLTPPSDRYDCHGYTFTSGDVFIHDNQVDKILKDNGYLVTTDPKIGDIVIYRVNGEVRHSGIITAVAGGKVTRVNSKWGRLNLFSHAPQDVPASYGSFTPWHSERSGKHKLRERSAK